MLASLLEPRRILGPFAPGRNRVLASPLLQQDVGEAEANERIP